MKRTLLHTLCLWAVGATVAFGVQANQPQTNGKLKVTALSPEETCYTGKPYVNVLSAYAFGNRNYDPQLNRWTSIDPSGFPDGANGFVYAPAPTSEVDSNGLWKIKLTQWNGGAWTDSRDIVPGGLKFASGGSLQLSGGSVGDTKDSWSFTGGSYSEKQYQEGGMVPDTYISIHQEYTVTVDEDGAIHFGGSGSEKSIGAIGIAIQGEYNYGDNSKSVDFTYHIGGAYQARGVNGAGVSINDSGVSLSWENPSIELGGFMSVSFSVVE